ncbi:LuxR C-terminal-related transcriptional regulator [Streptomyces sp. NPDC059385]|uniref:helix-turn-helix transcriptional regulator n=1 Tax=Streptomyces sp. NPDC059385 TaxID=3346817 RepID=UPI00367E5D39
MRLMERAAESHWLKTALASCGEGRGSTVLIEGPVGCGRTELLALAMREAWADGALVLRATGIAAERTLPLGILGQLAAGAPAGALTPRDGGTRGSRSASMELLTVAVRRMSEDAPVVICVDDWQHTDELSLAHLMHLAHATRTDRVLLVLTRGIDGADRGHMPDTELIRLDGLVRLTLAPLSSQGTRDLVRRDAPGTPAAATDRLYDLSGGNPLLLRALLEERRTAGADAEPEPHGPFAQAVLACLERSGPGALGLARALSVLDVHATPERAAALLEPPAGTAPAERSAAVPGVRPAAGAVRVAAALERAGLLRDGRFRHEAARLAVLGRMAPHERTALHARAAEAAREAGADAPDIAAQLLAARLVDRSWAVPVLHSAAAQLLSAGRPKRALAYLELAGEGIGDDQARTDNTLRMAAAAGRIDPGGAERRLRQPLEDARAGRLGSANLEALARQLAGHGRLDEAEEVLGLFPASTGAESSGRAAGADPFDGLAAFPRTPSRRPEGRREDGGPADTPSRSSATLWQLPEISPRAVEAAESFLRGVSPACATAGPTLQALRTLLHLGGAHRAERVLPWCREAVAEAERRGATGWAALFRAVHAQALLRQGRLARAESEARAALESVPRSSASSLLSLASGVLVQAALARGRTDEAAAELARPVPAALPASVHGLEYLRARGQFHLAASRYHAALGDFLEIGRCMKRWGLDRPVVIPWRTDAAEALHRLGETRQADRFVIDQLATADAADPWVQGISLRARAICQEPRKRQVCLARAGEALRRAGDRYELARTLAELGRVLQEPGETGRAAMVNRTAWHLADECGAHPLRNTIAHNGPREAPAPTRAPMTSFAEMVGRLSESERRVATLAVRGDTNREIAQKLSITVSTVEQHLTRAYRKLGVTRRMELPVQLQLLST